MIFLLHSADLIYFFLNFILIILSISSALYFRAQKVTQNKSYHWNHHCPNHTYNSTSYLCQRSVHLYGFNCWAINLFISTKWTTSCKIIVWQNSVVFIIHTIARNWVDNIFIFVIVDREVYHSHKRWQWNYQNSIKYNW